MDLSKERIDPTAEVDGIWVDYDTETAFKIARWMNPRHKAFIQKAVQPYLRKHRRGNLPQDVSERIEIQGVVNTILVDWRGVLDEGAEVPYSTGEALKRLNDSANSWLLTWITEESQDMGAYQAETLAEAVENVGEA